MVKTSNDALITFVLKNTKNFKPLFNNYGKQHYKKRS